MSRERFQAIVNPHSGGFSCRKVIKLLLGVWSGAVLCSIPTLLEYSVHTIHKTTSRTQTLEEFLQEMFKWNLSENEHICFKNNLKNDSSTNMVNSKETDVNVLWTPSSNNLKHFLDNETTLIFDYVTSFTAECSTNQYFVNDTVVQDIMRCGSTSPNAIQEWLSGLFLLLVAYIIPSVLIWVNYGRVIYFIIQFTKQKARQNPTIDFQSNFVLFKKKVKIVKMLIIVAALFELCWLPYFTIVIYAVSTI